MVYIFVEQQLKQIPVRLRHVYSFFLENSQYKKQWMYNRFEGWGFWALMWGGEGLWAWICGLWFSGLGHIFTKTMFMIQVWYK